MQLSIASVAIAAVVATSLPAHAQTEPHGWLNNETLKTSYGDFEFTNGYPAGDSGQRLLDIQKLNRAIDVYTTRGLKGERKGIVAIAQ